MCQRRYGSKTICGIFFFLLSLFISNFSLALPVSDNNGVGRSIIFEDSSSPSNQFYSNQQPSKINSLNSSQLSWGGPLSFGITWDSLNNYFLNAKYTKKINEQFAFSGLLEYGANIYRISATIGANFFNNLFKFTAERLSEVLPFQFDSGKINQRVAQNAFGIRVQHFLEDSLLHNINVGGYYAHAPSESLDPVYFAWNGVSSINYRRIAGSTSKGIDLSSDVKFSQSTLTGRIYYDTIRYDTVFNNPQTPNNDSSGLGGGIAFNQLITDTVNFSVEGNIRKIYDTYKIGVSWLPPYLASVGLELILSGERTISHNSTPNSTAVGLSFSFKPDLIGLKQVRYQTPSINILKDVGAWTNTPAVYMERVLVQAEQRTVELVDPLPMITFISPNTGPLSGNAVVTIFGKNFTEIQEVKFGDIQASSYVVESDTKITATVPTGDSGEVTVTVTNLRGKSVASEFAKFFYVPNVTGPAPPTVTNVSPNTGPTGGGTSVTITGTNFTGASAVKFGTTPVGSFIVVNATTITTTSPAGSGVVDVRVTTAGGTSATSSADQFTYFAAPTVTSVSPNAGSTTGATSVTITGTNFYNGASNATVSFGGTVATSVVVVSATTITATSPSHAAGTVDVTVTTPSGTSATSSADQFTYYAAPIVSFVDPNGGPITGATSVTITGTNFYNGATTHARVFFGATEATSVVIVNATKITAISPAHAAGTVDVRVTTESGTSATSANDHFTYYALPTVTGVSPNHGPQSGGTSLTITGTNFIGTTAVSLGGALASSYTVDNDNQITAVSPAHTAGTINVTVTTPGGTSVASAANEYTYSVFYINASAGAHGFISPSGNIALDEGASQTFAIVADTQYHIDDVIVDGVSVGAVSSYTFSNVTTNHTISASFASNFSPRHSESNIVKPVSGITSVASNSNSATYFAVAKSINNTSSTAAHKKSSAKKSTKISKSKAKRRSKK